MQPCRVRECALACRLPARHSLSDPVSHSSLDRSLKASSPTVFSFTHRQPSSLLRSRLHRSSGLGGWEGQEGR